MNRNVVRIQTELFKAGEMVRGHLIDIYTQPPLHCTWFPKMPEYAMLDDPMGMQFHGHPGKVMSFEEGGLFFTFDALGPEVAGVCKGDLDFLMSIMPASELFAKDIPRFAHMAEMSLKVFEDNPRWAMLALYKVDLDNNRVEFDGTLNLEETTTVEELMEAQKAK